MQSTPTRAPIPLSTPFTASGHPSPRAPSKPKRPTYSAAPLCTIDENVLTSSRFVDSVGRHLAYRDSSGRVNLGLCERSLAAADESVDSAADIHTLTTWARHAKRAIASRPADELCTLEEMVAEDDREREAQEVQAAREALPISQRKPKRSTAASVVATPEGAGATPVASRVETIIVLPAPAARRVSDADDDDDGEDGLAPPMTSGPTALTQRTVSMQRRLFRPPQPGDEPSDAEDVEAPPARNGASLLSQCLQDEEPSADLMYIRSLAEQREGCRRAESRSSDSDEEDIFEVLAILKESEDGKFLIRWEGYGPEEDSWEPEENVAPQLVQSFRQKHARAARHARDDYLDGRTRQLWCSTCEEHRPADCFSALQRKAAPACRSCLNHHYGIGGAPATPEAAAGTSTRHASRTAPHSMGSAGSKRPRALDASPLSPPPPPSRRRPVAREVLSARDADREVAKCRLYGFSSW